MGVLVVREGVPVIVDEPAREPHRVFEFAVAFHFLLGIAYILDGAPAFTTVNDAEDDQNQ